MSEILRKLKVRWNRGIGHLTEDGKHTFCGKDSRRWGSDEDATLAEFVEKVHPHCRSCARSAILSIGIISLSDKMEGE